MPLYVFIYQKFAESTSLQAHVLYSSTTMFMKKIVEVHLVLKKPHKNKPSYSNQIDAIIHILHANTGTMTCPQRKNEEIDDLFKVLQIVNIRLRSVYELIKFEI